MLSERITNINFSATAKINDEASKLIKSGIEIIDLSIGEPDLPVPQNIIDAAKTALENRFTKYTSTTGTSELKEAIISKMKADHNLNYIHDEIIVTSGAKQAIFNAVSVLVNEGEEVLIPAPYWVSYPEIVSFTGGIPKIINTKEENDFKMTAEDLENSITANTKVLILCNPSNPAGIVYSKNELNEICEVLRTKNITIISDEIYEKIIFDNKKFTGIAEVDEFIKQKTIVVNGVSKAYSMTGFRIGYAAGQSPVINAMAKLQIHSTSCASSISQYASVEALNGDQKEIATRVAEYEARRDFLYEELINIKNITCVKPAGAFYLFPKVSKYFYLSNNGHLIKSSADLAFYLLKEANVAVVPGSAFGNDNHIRLAFTTSIEKLKTAVERIKIALEKLK